MLFSQKFNMIVVRSLLLHTFSVVVSLVVNTNACDYQNDLFCLFCVKWYLELHSLSCILCCTAFVLVHTQRIITALHIRHRVWCLHGLGKHKQEGWHHGFTVQPAVTRRRHDLESITGNQQQVTGTAGRHSAQEH